VDGGQFEIGKTSEALKNIGMRDAKIYWRKSKIQYIMEDHPAITPEIIKKVPSIVENPIIVMKSKTIDSSITMFGDIKAGDSYVMVAVELNPTPAGGLEAEFNLISSAYDRSNNNAKNLIQTSEVLYLCDKKRADTLLMSLGVQFPSDQQVYGSIGSITYKDGKVNISGKKIFVDTSSKSVQKSRKANPQTSGKAVAKDPEVEHLKGMQRQTVAKYARTKVYTKAEALEIIEQAARMLDETYGFDGGFGEVSGFVKLTKMVKDAAAVDLWKAYNSANTEAEKLEIARKLADTLMAEAQLVTLASDEELAEAREVTDCLRLG